MKKKSTKKKLSEKELCQKLKHVKKIQNIAHEVKSCKGGYNHRCRECSLLFTPEEAREGRFIIANRTCARCLSIARMKELQIPLPACFGASYDPGNALCAKDCKLRHACLIQISESLYQEKPYVERTKHNQTFRSHIIRILRAIGRPVHIFDLMPVLERETKGRYKMDLTGSWIEFPKRICRTAPEVIALGSQFYVWAGCWDIRNGGSPGCSNNRAFRETLGHLSIQEIFKRIDAEL